MRLRVLALQFARYNVGREVGLWLTKRRSMLILTN